MISFMGGLIGVGLGCLFLESLHNINTQYFPVGVADLVGPWMLTLLAVAGGIGLVSGIVPAIRAAQLSVVDGLRRVI
jgi:ABC-type antimicrobial peptide transport system permease subunit